MKLLHQTNDLSYFSHKISTPVGVTGFLFVIEGTNDTALDINRDDFGYIEYRKRDKLHVRANLARLSPFNDLTTGNHLYASATAGAFQYGVYIPRWFIRPQVENIVPEDNAIFSIDFGDTSDLASGTVSLYAITDEGDQFYDCIIREDERDFNGAGVSTIENDSVENIFAAYLTDNQNVTAEGLPTMGNTAITRVEGRVGAEHEFNMTTFAAILHTNIMNDVTHDDATAFNDMVELWSARGNDVLALLNRNINVVLHHSGDIHPHLLIVGGDMNPNKLRETRIAVRAKRQRVVNSRRAQGLTRTADTVTGLVL